MTSFLSRPLARRAATQATSVFVCDGSCGFVGSSSIGVTNSLGTITATSLLCGHQSPFLHNGRQERFHSTAASKESPSSNASTSSPSSLRHLIRPFLLKCHPDAVQNYPDAKRVNLVAIQTLNAFVDSMEDVMARTVSAQKLKEDQWPTSIGIEYLMPVPDPMMGRQKKPRAPTLARRRIELALPTWKLRQQVLASPIPTPILDEHNIFRKNNYYSDQTRSLRRFQWLVQRELAKLVRSAGLAVPSDFVPASLSAENLGQDALKDFLLDQDVFDDDHDNEHGTPTFGHFRRFDSSSSSSSRQPPRPQPRVIRHPPTQREKNRDAFMSRVNWKRQEEAYQQALRGMEEDLMTDGLISENPTRKQNFVDQVLARVRVQRKQRRPTTYPRKEEETNVVITSNIANNNNNNDDNNDTSQDDNNDLQPSSQIKNDAEGQVDNDTKGQNDNNEHEEKEDYELVPVLDQLIALRRLSLLLFDNFDELELEDMGSVWENMVIVLTAPRTYNTSSSAMNRRKRRRDQQHHLATTVVD